MGVGTDLPVDICSGIEKSWNGYNGKNVNGKQGSDNKNEDDGSTGVFGKPFTHFSSPI